jgi:hypothetical protein
VGSAEGNKQVDDVEAARNVVQVFPDEKEEQTGNQLVRGVDQLTCPRPLRKELGLTASAANCTLSKVSLRGLLFGTRLGFHGDSRSKCLFNALAFTRERPSAADRRVQRHVGPRPQDGE